MHPLVHIIILNWNGFEDTLRCIASLEGQTYPNFRIIIVDNGSTDGSIQAFSGLSDRVTLQALPENLGFTGGNNYALPRGFERGAEYVWLFNNDAVAAPDVLARLVAGCEADRAIGLATPLVLEPDGHSTIHAGCGLFDLSVPDYVPSCDVKQAEDWQIRFPDRIAVHGTALLVRRSLFQAIGGLDDVFFAYWEDIDYSIRSARAGFRNIVVRDAIVYHAAKPTQTDPGIIKPHYYYFMSRNELLMWRKFCSPVKFLKAVLWGLRRQLRQVVRMPGNTAGIDAILAGLWHGWLGRGGPYNPARRMPTPLRGIFRRYPAFWLRRLGDRTSIYDR